MEQEDKIINRLPSEADLKTLERWRMAKEADRLARVLGNEKAIVFPPPGSPPSSVWPHY